MKKEDRIEHLRQYIYGCLKVGLLVPTDFTNGKTVEKLLHVISQDSKLVLREFAREGLARLAGIGMMKLAQLAEEMASGRRKGG
jgi:hypothetical protein